MASLRSITANLLPTVSTEHEHWLSPEFLKLYHLSVPPLIRHFFDPYRVRYKSSMGPRRVSAPKQERETQYRRTRHNADSPQSDKLFFPCRVSSPVEIVFARGKLPDFLPWQLYHFRFFTISVSAIRPSRTRSGGVVSANECPQPSLNVWFYIGQVGGFSKWADCRPE